MERTCLDCGKPLIGRADKKFCDDSCRSNYNNRLNHASNDYVKKVNTILKKNRKILERANSNGKTKIEREKLAKAGFNFQYFTNLLETEKGNRYYFCYEHGYMELSQTYILLVVRK